MTETTKGPEWGREWADSPPTDTDVPYTFDNRPPPPPKLDLLTKVVVGLAFSVLGLMLALIVLGWVYGFVQEERAGSFLGFEAGIGILAGFGALTLWLRWRFARQDRERRAVQDARDRANEFRDTR